MTTPNKPELRALMRERLRELSVTEREARSAGICEKILALLVWQSARVVATFEPMRDEPALGLLTSDLRARGGELIAIASSAREHTAVPVNAPIDLVLVPGLAFTRGGDRLGHGGGFFDRFLVHRAPHAATIGVGFAFQIVDTLPLEPHDVPLQLAVTD